MQKLLRCVATVVLIASVGCDSDSDPANPDRSLDRKVVKPAKPVKLAPVDASFLIPPPLKFKVTTKANQSKVLRVSAEGKHGALLPRDNFFSVFNTPALEFHPDTARGMPTDPYEHLVIVGVRYDPCPPQAFHGAAAKPVFQLAEGKKPGKTPVCDGEEFRLVAMPMTEDGTAVTDAGIHLVYAVSPTEGKIIRDELRALKAECAEGTDDAPVGPHPCLAGYSEGDKDAVAFFKKVRAFILKHAGAERLKGVATMITKAGAAKDVEWHWRLFVHPPGVNALVQFPPPGLGIPGLFGLGDKNVMAFKPSGEYVPEPTTELSDGKTHTARTAMIPKIAGNKLSPKDVAKDELEEGLLAAALASNPRFVIVRANDCASCHVQAGSLARMKTAGGIPAKILAKVESVEYKNQTPQHPDTTRLYLESNWDVINFGYHTEFKGPTLASVNDRTRNEAEEVVKYINEVLDK